MIGLKIETLTDIGVLITISVAIIYLLGRLNTEGSYKKEDKPITYLWGAYVLFYSFVLPLYLIYLIFNNRFVEILNIKLFSITIIQCIMFYCLKFFYYEPYLLRRYDVNLEEYLEKSLDNIKKVNIGFYNWLLKTIEKINNFPYSTFFYNIFPFISSYINLGIFYYVVFINNILFFKLVSIGLLFSFFLLYFMYSSVKQNSSYPLVKIKIDNEKKMITGNLLSIKGNLLYLSDNRNNKYYNINTDKIIYMEFKKNV